MTRHTQSGRTGALRLVSTLSAIATAYTGAAFSQDAVETTPVDPGAAAPVATVPVSPESAPTSEEASTADEQSGNRFIGEVVVTAQKREERLQDVPISVQAFSAEALDARGIEEPKALQLATPGLSYTIFAGYSIIFIRGVGTDAFIPSADASVATYIDNIYYPFGHSLAAALGSIERVEVLKGPQGTLFGRNSTAGAINIVTKQPGPDFESEVTISAEDYDKTNFRAYTNIPVTDSFSVSASGLYYKEDNYYKLSDASPRDSLPQEMSRAYSLKAGWRPLDDLSATVGYSYINTTGGLPMSLATSDVKPLGQLTGVTQQPDYETGEDAPVFIDTKSRVVTGDVQYALPWFDTRLILGDQRIKSPALADFDGSSQPLVVFTSEGQFSDSKTLEFQILSNKDSWLAEKLTYIAGFYYIDSSAGYDPVGFRIAPNLLQDVTSPTLLAQFPLAGDAVNALIGPGGLVGALSTPLLNAVNAATGSNLNSDQLFAQLLDTGIVLSMRGVLDTKAKAGFFQTTYNFTDQFALTLGGRYQAEDRTLAKSSVGYSPDGNTDVAIPVFNFNAPPYHDGPRSAHTTNFSPKVVLDYKPTDDHLVYGSYSRGFKSGTFNILAVYLPSRYIEPEKVTAYELGYKGTWLDGSMRFNTAVFQNKIENLQAQTVSLTSGGAVQFETAGSARVRGVDFDLLWQVAPSSLPGLALTLSGAYLDAKYTDYRNGSGFNEVTGLYQSGQDFTGNRMVRTPKYSGAVGPSYTFDFDSSSLELATDLYYNSGSYFSAQNTETTHQDSYKVLNARISYFYQPWDFRVTLMGRNLTDTKYAMLLQELDFGTPRLLAPPVSYGVKLQWSFGA